MVIRPRFARAERTALDSHSRLSNALQANRVPELLTMGLYAATVAVGEPAVIVGDTAILTQVRDEEGSSFALRVVKEHGEGGHWRRHYAAMQESLPGAAREYIPAGVRVLPNGITLVGRKMPAMLMEWIDGPTLLQAADRAAHDRNADILQALAQAVRDLSNGMRDARIAHGDLAPDNLMLRSNGDLVCVDLDTMQWPGVRKRTVEGGSVAYRHPGRNATVPHQDAFATLVMYVSLMLIAEKPTLRNDLGNDASIHGGALLFTSWDIQDPAGSRAFAQVREQVGRQGRSLVNVLAQASTAEAFRAQEFLDAAYDIGHADGPKDVTLPELPADQDSLGEAVSRLREMYGTADTIAPINEPSASFARTWPRSVEPVQEPRDAANWPSPSTPTSRSTPPRRPASRTVEPLEPPQDPFTTLDREEQEIQKAEARIEEFSRRQMDADVIRIADDLERQKRPMREATRRLVRTARERHELRVRLTRALERHDRRELTDLAVSGDLAMLGDTDRSSLVKVLQALEMPALERAVETDDDTLILMWYDADLFDDDALPDSVRRRVDLAQRRLRWLDQLRMALKSRKVSQIEDLLDTAPQGALHQLSEGERTRARQLVDRHAALKELDRALASGTHRSVVAALSAIDRVGARIEDPRTWESVRGVVEKAALMDQIAKAAREEPPDDRALASLVPAVKSMGLAHDPALRDDLSIERLDAMVTRGAAIRRIRRGIRNNDDRAIRLAAFPDTTGAIAFLTEEEQERVEAARSRKLVRRFDTV